MGLPEVEFESATYNIDPSGENASPLGAVTTELDTAASALVLVFKK